MMSGIRRRWTWAASGGWWSSILYNGGEGRGTRVLLLGAVIASAAVAGAKPVPELKLRDLQGQVQRLSDYRGQIVVLNFWATWCGPCKEEMPRLMALRSAYAGRKLRVIAVSIDEPKTQRDIVPFLAREKIDLPVWVGADTETLGRYHMGEIVPATLILDERGEPVTRIEGEARETDLRQAVDWLLGGRSGEAPPAVTKRY